MMGDHDRVPAGTAVAVSGVERIVCKQPDPDATVNALSGRSTADAGVAVIGAARSACGCAGRGGGGRRRPGRVRGDRRRRCRSGRLLSTEPTNSAADLGIQTDSARQIFGAPTDHLTYLDPGRGAVYHFRNATDSNDVLQRLRTRNEAYTERSTSSRARDHESRWHHPVAV